MNVVGIDVGYGWFASRTFKADSTINDNDVITYYEEMSMTLEDMEQMQDGPSYTSIISVFQGMVSDEYDHENDIGAVVNDFLDKRNSSYFTKDDMDEDSDLDEGY